LRYASNRGDPDLRNALAAYLCDFRAARCHPDQIVIVGGMQQAMLISATALLNPGEPAWIEDPCYQQTRRVLTLADARILPKPLDDPGNRDCAISKRTFSKTHLRHPFASVSSRGDNEFPAQDDLARFRSRA
jgi:Transcriptional regulators containing a DNA-binding HTH domain and an aminotransferase domain (MocR family) and their eukaryotic orthologs